jgi:hypothetical protein
MQEIAASIVNVYFDPERRDIRLSVEVSIPESLDPLKRVIIAAPIVEAERDMDHALSTLKPIEERLVRIKYGYRSASEKDEALVGNHHWRQWVIAERMGISQPHVSRVSTVALRKLKHPSRSRWLRRHVPDEGSLPDEMHPGAKRILAAVFGFVL